MLESAFFPTLTAVFLVALGVGRWQAVRRGYRHAAAARVRAELGFEEVDAAAAEEATGEPLADVVKRLHEFRNDPITVLPGVACRRQGTSLHATFRFVAADPAQIFEGVIVREAGVAFRSMKSMPDILFEDHRESSLAVTWAGDGTLVAARPALPESAENWLALYTDAGRCFSLLAGPAAAGPSAADQAD